MSDSASPKNWQNIRDAGYAAKLAYVYSQPDKYANKKQMVEHLHQKLEVVTLNAPSTGLLSTRHVNSFDKINVTNFVKRGDFVSMGGTGSLAGDTYVIEDVAIGQSFMVTHERMDTSILPASKRFMKNVMDIAFPRHNPVSAHSSENMLSYIEVMAQKNQPAAILSPTIIDEPAPSSGLVPLVSRFRGNFERGPK